MELPIEQALLQGVEAHKAGKVQEADRYYTAILKANPNHPDANHNMGVLAVGIGKVEEALPFFQKALEANPSIEQFWLSYIDALIKIGRMDEAKAAIDEAKENKIKDDVLNKLLQKINLPTDLNPSELSRDELFKTAIELREDGKFEKAIDLLKEIRNTPQILVY